MAEILTQETSLVVRLDCGKCGIELSTSDNSRGTSHVIAVDPCQSCIDEEVQDALDAVE